MRGERALQAWLSGELAGLAVRHPIWWLKTHGDRYQRAGLPDVLVAVEGRIVWLELKSPGETQTPRQRLEAAAIERAGAPVRVCTTRAECWRAIAEVAEDLGLKGELLQRAEWQEKRMRGTF